MIASRKDAAIITHDIVANPIPINMTIASTCTGFLENRYIPLVTGWLFDVVAKLIIDIAEKIILILTTDTPIQNHMVLLVLRGIKTAYAIIPLLKMVLLIIVDIFPLNLIPGKRINLFV